jgi:hypothetical protein
MPCASIGFGWDKLHIQHIIDIATFDFLGVYIYIYMYIYTHVYTYTYTCCVCVVCFGVLFALSVEDPMSK